MALMFARKLAIPLWVIAFFVVAITAPPSAMLFLMPPTTLLVIAVGIALILVTMSGAIPSWRMSRSLVPVRPSRRSERTKAEIAIVAGAGVRRFDEPNRRTADEALDCARMDDDGGWQLARPPAQGGVSS